MADTKTAANITSGQPPTAITPPHIRDLPGVMKELRLDSPDATLDINLLNKANLIYDSISRRRRFEDVSGSNAFSLIETGILAKLLGREGDANTIINVLAKIQPDWREVNSMGGTGIFSLFMDGYRNCDIRDLKKRELNGEWILGVELWIRGEIPSGDALKTGLGKVRDEVAGIYAFIFGEKEKAMKRISALERAYKFKDGVLVDRAHSKPVDFVTATWTGILYALVAGVDPKSMIKQVTP
jgi:hypothetical protein